MKDSIAGDHHITDASYASGAQKDAETRRHGDAETDSPSPRVSVSPRLCP